MELYTKKSKVVKLSPDDFEHGILNSNSAKDSRVSLVMFYVDWCPHCQHAEPVWTKFAKTAPKDATVGVVDSVKHPELGSEFGVSSYPTIKVFNQQGSIVGEYAGSRDIDSLNEFAASLVSPPASPKPKKATKAKATKAKKAPAKKAPAKKAAPKKKAPAKKAAPKKKATKAKASAQKGGKKGGKK